MAWDPPGLQSRQFQENGVETTFIHSISLSTAGTLCGAYCLPHVGCPCEQKSNHAPRGWHTLWHFSSHELQMTEDDKINLHSVIDLTTHSQHVPI